MADGKRRGTAREGRNVPPPLNVPKTVTKARSGGPVVWVKTTLTEREEELLKLPSQRERGQSDQAAKTDKGRQSAAGRAAQPDVLASDAARMQKWEAKAAKRQRSGVRRDWERHEAQQQQHLLETVPQQQTYTGAPGQAEQPRVPATKTPSPDAPATRRQLRRLMALVRGMAEYPSGRAQQPQQHLLMMRQQETVQQQPHFQQPDQRQEIYTGAPGQILQDVLPAGEDILTAIIPVIGYEKAKQLAEIAVETGGDITEIVRDYFTTLVKWEYSPVIMADMAAELTVARKYDLASVHELQEAIAAWKASKAQTTARNPAKGAKAKPRARLNARDLSAPQVVAVIEDSTLGRLHRRYTELLESIELPKEGFKTPDQAKAAARLSTTFANLQARRARLGLESLPTDARVTEARRLRSLFYYNRPKPARSAPPRLRLG